MKRRTEMNRTKDKMIKKKDRKRRSRQPALRFSPTAWAKLHFFCHHGETEIGGFGMTPADDLLLVESFETIKQETSAVSVAFDDAAVADFFEVQVDAGRTPSQFARIWLHTHPGDSPVPSLTDEETFARVFGKCDWAVMFILARYGKTYSRLRFNTGPGGEIMVPVSVDYARPFPGSDHESWRAEFDRNIHPDPLGFGLAGEVRRGVTFDDGFGSGAGRNEDSDALVPIEDTEDLIDLWERESEVWP